MDIGDIISRLVAAAKASESSGTVNATARPTGDNGWTIQANGETKTIPQGGRVTIGDTTFYSNQVDGSLVVEQEGEEAVTYARPEPEAPPTTTSTSTTTTTTTLPPSVDASAVTVEIELQAPGEEETSATLPEDPAVVTLPEDPAVVTRGTLPEDPALATRGTLPEDPA